MSKYEDIQYLVDRPEPSEIFLKARNIAGIQLQDQFERCNKKSIFSNSQVFKWIKAELTYPSFDHLTFAYKSTIFSIIIELIDQTGTSFNTQQKERLLKACDEYNLVPCTFKIQIIGDDELKPVAKGWNLCDAKTGQKIDPLKVATSKTTKMSVWELNNFAIQVVRSELEKEGNEILSFCDMPEINPQIWFKDIKGNICWVVVKLIIDDRDIDYRKWTRFEAKNPQLKPYDGYFAPIQFFSTKTNSTFNLNRGDGMHVNYKGLERIYVAM